MRDKKTLNIHVEPIQGQVFDAKIGWLALPKASRLNVSIKDYKDRLKALETRQKKEKDDLYSTYLTEWDRVDAEEKASKTFVTNSLSRYNKGEISATTHQANIDARSKGNAERNGRKKKLSDNYNKQNDELSTQQNKELTDLKSEYAGVRWVWQLIGSEVPKLTRDSFNEALDSGEPELSLDFDDFVEGGGAAYLEPFWEGTVPVGKYPHGVIINAKGKKPQILKADWRDANDNLVTQTVKFGSTVYLNIYTEALYGHNIKIQLLDKDEVIRVLSLGLTHADDKLFAAEYLNNNVDVEKREEKDISKKDSQFIRAVSVHKTDKGKYPEGVKIGRLVEEGVSKTDEKVTHVPNVQKCKFPIFIDPFWKMAGGDNLAIYPTIENNIIPNGIKTLSEVILKVSENGEMVGANISNSNQVVLLSEVQTNMAAFHLCQYTLIDYINDKDKAINIYTEQGGVSENPNLEVGIIVGSDPKKFTIKVDDDADATECSNDGKENDHDKNIFTYDKTKLPKNISINNHLLKKIEGTAKFDYSGPLLNYIWPTKSVYGTLPAILIKSETCRHQHNLNLKIYPDIRWELAFLFALKNPLAYTYSAGKDNKSEVRDVKADLIYTEAYKKAMNSGTDGNKLKKGEEIDSEFFVSLKAKYNKVKNAVPDRFAGENETGDKWVKKIRDFVNILIKLKKLAQDVKEKAGGAARKPSTTIGGVVGDNPFSFEIMSPKIGAVIQWQAEEVSNEETKYAIANTGTIKFVADPLIGAEFTINMLSAASYMHPVVKVIKKALDVTLDALGGYMKLDLTFYGELKITIESLKINSLEGVTITENPPKIDGKMGLKLVFILHAEGKVDAFGMKEVFEFKADAKLEADAYFGGTALIKADLAGVYADITGQFSGLLFTLKVDVKIGQYYKKIKIESDPIFQSDAIPLGKFYLINNTVIVR